MVKLATSKLHLHSEDEPTPTDLHSQLSSMVGKLYRHHPKSLSLLLSRSLLRSIPMIGYRGSFDFWEHNKRRSYLYANLTGTLIVSTYPHQLPFEKLHTVAEHCFNAANETQNQAIRVHGHDATKFAETAVSAYVSFATANAFGYAYSQENTELLIEAAIYILTYANAAISQTESLFNDFQVAMRYSNDTPLQLAPLWKTMPENWSEIILPNWKKAIVTTFNDTTTIEQYNQILVNKLTLPQANWLLEYWLEQGKFTDDSWNVRTTTHSQQHSQQYSQKNITSPNVLDTVLGTNLDILDIRKSVESNTPQNQFILRPKDTESHRENRRESHESHHDSHATSTAGAKKQTQETSLNSINKSANQVLETSLPTQPKSVASQISDTPDSINIARDRTINGTIGSTGRKKESLTEQQPSSQIDSRLFAELDKEKQPKEQHRQSDSSLSLNIQAPKNEKTCETNEKDKASASAIPQPKIRKLDKEHLPKSMLDSLPIIDNNEALQFQVIYSPQQDNYPNNNFAYEHVDSDDTLDGTLNNISDNNQENDPQSTLLPSPAELSTQLYLEQPSESEKSTDYRELTLWQSKNFLALAPVFAQLLNINANKKSQFIALLTDQLSLTSKDATECQQLIIKNLKQTKSPKRNWQVSTIKIKKSKQENPVNYIISTLFTSLFAYKTPFKAFKNNFRIASIGSILRFLLFHLLFIVGCLSLYLLLPNQVLMIEKSLPWLVLASLNQFDLVLYFAEVLILYWLLTFRSRRKAFLLKQFRRMYHKKEQHKHQFISLRQKLLDRILRLTARNKTPILIVIPDFQKIPTKYLLPTINLLKQLAEQQSIHFLIGINFQQTVEEYTNYSANEALTNQALSDPQQPNSITRAEIEVMLYQLFSHTMILPTQAQVLPQTLSDSNQQKVAENAKHASLILKNVLSLQENGYLTEEEKNRLRNIEQHLRPVTVYTNITIYQITQQLILIKYYLATYQPTTQLTAEEWQNIISVLCSTTIGKIEKTNQQQNISNNHNNPYTTHNHSPSEPFVEFVRMFAPL